MCSTHLRDILGLNVLDGEHKERTIMKIVVIGGTGLIGSRYDALGPDFPLLRVDSTLGLSDLIRAAAKRALDGGARRR